MQQSAPVTVHIAEERNPLKGSQRFAMNSPKGTDMFLQEDTLSAPYRRWQTTALSFLK
jgi:hypothetical protein